MSAARSFIDKWQQDEPELRLLAVFLPELLRQLGPIWLTLLHELDQAMFETSDPAVSRTKLAWWGEDLAAGRDARHPLAQALLSCAVVSVAPMDWRQLARSAIALAEHDSSAADWDALRARWQPYAEQVAALESALFGQPSATDIVLVQSIRGRCLRALQLQQPERMPVPLQLRARFGAELATQAEAWRQVGAALSAVERLRRNPAPMHRHLIERRDGERIARLAAGAALPLRPVSPWRPLWWSWRAARAAAART